MPCPSLVGRRYHPCLGIIVKFWVLAQAAPEAVLFAGIVGFVDEVPLVGVGIVLVDESLYGTIPGLRLEGATIA